MGMADYRKHQRQRQVAAFQVDVLFLGGIWPRSRDKNAGTVTTQGAAMPHQPDRTATQPALDPAMHTHLMEQFRKLWERFQRMQLEEAARKMAGPLVKVKHSA
jgi:hypothetical protein